MKTKLLFVDDEPHILDAYRRSLRRQFEIDTALGANAGLDMLAKNGPYAVVISDYKMPEINGVQFLTAVREQYPDSVRVMLTGQAEMNAAIAAINDGNIFRFLSKPCPQEQLIKVMEDCLAQYRLITSERELLEHTLSGSAAIMVDILSIVNPLAFSSSSRIRDYAGQLSKLMGLREAWAIELAGLLSQIGCVSLPKKLVQKKYLGEPLSFKERTLFESHPSIAHGLLEKIPRLEMVAEIVANQLKPFGEYPKAANPTAAVLGAQILKISIDFDQYYLAGLSAAESLVKIQESPTPYNPALVELLPKLDFSEEKRQIVKVGVEELTANMRFVEDVLSEEGLLLVAKGQRVTRTVITHLQNYVLDAPIREPLIVST